MWLCLPRPGHHWMPLNSSLLYGACLYLCIPSIEEASWSQHCDTAISQVLLALWVCGCAQHFYNCPSPITCFSKWETQSFRVMLYSAALFQGSAALKCIRNFPRFQFLFLSVVQCTVTVQFAAVLTSSFSSSLSFPPPSSMCMGTFIKHCSKVVLIWLYIYLHQDEFCLKHGVERWDNFFKKLDATGLVKNPQHL